MSDLDRYFEQCRLPPYPHQRFGIETLVKWDDPARGRTIGGCVFLTDETGAGKTKQVIDAAQILFRQGKVANVVIVAPGAVRSVWYESELGELAKHLWKGLHSLVVEHRSRPRAWTWETNAYAPLTWYISNFEFIRSEARLNELLADVSKHTLLVIDESACVKNAQAKQTKAVRQLRKAAGRVVLLNGTPISDKPFDLFSQANLLDPRILDCSSMTKFKARYAVMGGYMATTPWGKVPTQVLRYQNLDDLQKRMGPYVLRRLKKDCIELPPKLDPVVLTATLTPSTWKLYTDMREEMVSWLSATSVSTASQAIVKVMRLSQITSGLLGGVEDVDGNILAPYQEIGSEKLDLLLDWLPLKLDEDPGLKLLISCRFKPELERVVAALRQVYPGMAVGRICGGQSREDRVEALKLMDPRTTPTGPATVVMTSAGAVGLTLTASHTVVRLSRDTSLYTWLQGEDRVHRPTQTSPVSYFDVIAEGPRGQKTIDKAILAALIAKHDIATWTTAAWVQKIQEE